MAKSIPKAPMSVITFVKEAREELQKVTWPTRETTIRYTIIVIVTSIVVGLITGGIDYLFALVIEKLVF